MMKARSAQRAATRAATAKADAGQGHDHPRRHRAPTGTRELKNEELRAKN